MNKKDNIIYSSKEYKVSQGAYILECAFEYFVAILVADSYLSKILAELGMSDYMIGLMSSVISVAFVFQLFSMVLVRHLSNTKILPSILHLIGGLFFTLIYFIPFFDFIPDEYKSTAAVICIIGGYLGNYTVSSIIYKWGNSFVHPFKRATFSSTKEMVSLIGGMVFTLVMGQMIDFFDASGRSDAGYIFVGIVILISTLLDFCCLMVMKRERDENVCLKEVKPFLSSVSSLVKNKSYCCLVFLDSLQKAGVYIVVGFLGTFKIKELGMSIGLVTIVTMVATGVRFLVTRPFGRLSDKTSYVTGITIGLIIEAIGYLFLIFITPQAWWFIIGYQVLYSVSAAATGQNLFNAVYSYVDQEHFVQAFALKNCISGVVGFLVSLGAASIVKAVQGESGEGMMSIFGTDIYVQQFLGILAFIITLMAFVFARVVMRKQKVIGK